MDNEREPLGTKSVNVATVHPTVSKLPALTPRSRLPTPGMKNTQALSVCGEKRKASGSPKAADKKICLNLSMSSDVSSSSDVSTISSLSTKSSGSKKATVPVSRGKTVSRVAGINGPRGAGTIGSRGATTGIGARRPAPATSTVRKAPGGAAARPPPKPASVPVRPPVSTTAKTNAGGVGGGKKRAAWDLKGRLQDMESAMTHLLKQKENLEMETCTSGDRLVQMEELNTRLRGAVAEKDSEAQSVQQRAAYLQQQLRDVEEEHDRKLKKLQRDISDAQFECATITRQKETLQSELDAARQEAAGLRSTVASLSAAQEGVRAELASVKLLLEAAQEAGHTKDGQIADLKKVVSAQNLTMEEMTMKMREHEASRRKLHNTIQELKGNIRVFCRVRPLLGDEISNNEDATTITHMTFPDEDGKVVELEKLNDANPK
ncbi:hypothetical protein LSAT2_017315 [Lamellibrachia satsuma]|nr:hypothetical protein LSAT2_017315 [Lamellibrachia satsuma]